MLASFALSLLLATSALASPFNDKFGPCGTHPSAEDVIAAEKQFLEKKLENPQRDDGTLALRNLTIYWHVISEDNSVAGGNITDAQIASQIDVLNKDWKIMGVNWILGNTSRIVNKAWYYNWYKSPTDLAMRTALRRGSAEDLNVYSVGQVNYYGQRVGYSSFPWDYQSSPVNDGVVLDIGSLPGGSIPGYNLGRTLSHEAGHWGGLYHPFQGGCSTPNDYVDDTPAEADFATGCPTTRDSCPGFPGADLVRNHMDYTNDNCKTSDGGFTPGQISRSSQAFAIYRNGK
ncbi:hypothetical protein H0H87_006201 [Tephrocybe sp. NHM501043]|nr:hypothetical protein H0H87_006201 [Tephrocybe sp. NHM501043]